MSKSIAAVALVAGMLSFPGSVQAGGYDGYYYGGGHYGGTTHLIRLPSPVRQAPIPPPPQDRTARLWVGLYSPSASPQLRAISLLGWRPLCRRALCAALCGTEMVSRVRSASRRTEQNRVGRPFTRE